MLFQSDSSFRGKLGCEGTGGGHSLPLTRSITIERIQTRVNNQIRISPLRVIGPDGTQYGVITVEDALNRAREAGLDLVEVAPNERPPVCRIMDFGKYKYEKNKKSGQ
ncbi:MAG: translation initiation factor IF-3, partial [Pirellula sp.]